MKWSDVERAQRTIRYRLYRYFTNTNKHKYIDVLKKFVEDYNDTIHSTTGMAPSNVTDSNVHAILKKINKKLVVCVI